MAAFHDHLVDLIEQFRREPAHVVLEGLEMVLGLVEFGMAEHQAQRPVFVHQFEHPVVVRIQVDPHHAANKGRPQRHSGAAVALVHRRRDPRFEQRKDLFAQRHIHVHVLQAA